MTTRETSPPRRAPTPGLVLGIETSCDETAAAVVRGGRGVLSSVVASQDELHAEYRGVVPEIASRAHAERILGVVERAVAEAGVALGDIDAVAVGNRPGLIGPLLVGISAAKALAWTLGVPVVGVDHVHAHLHAARLDTPADAPSPFPAIGLVVSGGHTSLYRCDSPTSLARLGGTIDDAAGEAFDKAAAILGLPFPGGPSIDRLAATGNERAISFPISRLSKDSLDFSFSGLKTAVLYAVRGVPADPRSGRGGVAPVAATPAEIAASFQYAAVRSLSLKLGRALDLHPDRRAILIGGGVSANTRLRRELAELAAARGLALHLPAMAYCVDNAAMIAGLAFEILAARGWVGDDLTMTATPTTGA